MAKQILIRPVITEKAEPKQDSLGQYTFVVNRNANKVEIRKAVEDTYGVTVESVNTLLMPSKRKNRTTKSGIIRGRIPSYKKAIVTLAPEDSIDFYGEI